MINTINKKIVFEIVKKIKTGKVATYKSVSDKAKLSSPRLVGKILHLNTDPFSIPCHRVVRSDGTLASGYKFGGRNMQRKKLEKEGIRFINNKIDLGKYLCD